MANIKLKKKLFFSPVGFMCGGYQAKKTVKNNNDFSAIFLSPIKNKSVNRSKRKVVRYPYWPSQYLKLNHCFTFFFPFCLLNRGIFNLQTDRHQLITIFSMQLFSTYGLFLTYYWYESKKKKNHDIYALEWAWPTVYSLYINKVDNTLACVLYDYQSGILTAYIWRGRKQWTFLSTCIQNVANVK